MSKPNWINNCWERDKILSDPAFQDFIDGLFDCRHVKRITLLGSLVRPIEPFSRYDNPYDADIDIGLEYDDEIPKTIPHPWSPEVSCAENPATEEIKNYLMRFNYDGYCVLIPSPLAPDSPFGRNYRVHIEYPPIGEYIVLRER